jgi:UDP-glucuronate 4-epimerase
MNILITGAAGFIGYHAAARLLEEGHHVTGADNLNAYYDPALKQARLDRLLGRPNFQFERCDLGVRAQAEVLFRGDRPDLVIHLAAQAGVRHSLENPHAYVDSNIAGFLHVLEGCRQNGVDRLIYASSSSVYAGNTKTPFSVRDCVDHPISLYAATKRSNELMAHCYTHLFGLRATGLRFFTVYGPWGRPDMAPFKFADRIARGMAIDIYNYGRMTRDFTYIDDIVEGLIRVIPNQPGGHRIYNIGNNQPVALMDFVHELERAFGRRARRRFLPIQPGDVPFTHADIEDFASLTGFRPATSVAEGVQKLARWYREYYSLKFEPGPRAFAA